MCYATALLFVSPACTNELKLAGRSDNWHMQPRIEGVLPVGPESTLAVSLATSHMGTASLLVPSKVDCIPEAPDSMQATQYCAKQPDGRSFPQSIPHRVPEGNYRQKSLLVNA
ncbi:hypothetical protein BJ875DRAFT_538561 [Amylocarpus encephaloides]|uniref:Uncharacterized protein n=1 Tax=Amylocarpus encephaloides TaxID=45428 RepID=A0A9P7YTC5_9HELO|nr:hypothetical protein BJ875DRAFT_538561 [Amylocarpus encephaloides]